MHRKSVDQCFSSPCHRHEKRSTQLNVFLQLLGWFPLTREPDQIFFADVVTVHVCEEPFQSALRAKKYALKLDCILPFTLAKHVRTTKTLNQRHVHISSTNVLQMFHIGIGISGSSVTSNLKCFKEAWGKFTWCRLLFPKCKQGINWIMRNARHMVP